MATIEQMIYRTTCEKLAKINESILVPWWILRRIEQAPSRVPLYHVKVEKEIWQFDLRSPSRLDIAKEVKPPCFISLDGLTLEEIYEGRSTIIKSYNEGRIEVEENLTLAVHLLQLLDVEI